MKHAWHSAAASPVARKPTSHLQGSHLQAPTSHLPPPTRSRKRRTHAPWT
ncbi:hypothetical protein MY8738_005908 [Beauveria namnaoensis]